MDSFMNMAKQGYSAYQQSQNQGQQQPQGGSQYNTQGGALNLGGAAEQAKHEANDQDGSLFDSALSFLNQKKDNNEVDGDVDEDDVQRAHAEVYERGNGQNMNANSMGAAAAMQAMKMFTSGGASSGHQNQTGSGGGGMQAMLVGKAMSEAAKLFDSSPPAQGNKQDAVSSAGLTVMKLLLKSKFSGTTGAGSGGGGLAGLAGKFL